MDLTSFFKARRRMLLVATGIPLVICLTVVLLASLRGDEWKARAIEAVSAQHGGHLDVHEVTLSWWNGFPHMSVDLGDVAFTNSHQDTLIQASRIGLEIEILSLVGKSPDIHTITLEDGQLHLAQDRRGTWNVSKLLKSPEKDTSDEQAKLSLTSVRLKNIELTLALDQEFSASAMVHHAKIDLTDSLNSWRWTMDAAEVEIAASKMPELQSFSLFTQGVSTRTGDGLWSLTSDVEMAGTTIEVAATYRNDNDWQAQMLVPRVTLSGVERLVRSHPWQGKLSLGHNFQLKAHLNPASTHLTWSTTPASFQVAPSLTGLTMALQGACSGRGEVLYERGVWNWTVDEVLASGSGWSLEGNIRPNSSNQYFFDGSLEIDVSMPWEAWVPNLSQSFTALLPQSGTARADGNIVVDLNAGTLSPRGTLDLTDISGKLNGQQYLVNAHAMDFRGPLLSSDSVHVSWAGNVGVATLNDLSWKSLSNFEPLRGKIDVAAESINVPPFLAWWNHLDRDASQSAQLLPAGSELTLHVQSDVLEWDALMCRQIDVTSKIEHSRWTIYSARFQGLEGKAHVEGALAPGRAGWQLTLRGTADDVSLPKLFSTYNNFGQSLLRYDHLSGAISTAGNLGMSWGLDGSWHSEHFTASLATTLNHVRLTELEVFEEVANYLEGHRLIAPLVDPDDLRERLRDVALEPVEQRIDVRGQMVRLPMTVIESSAMNVAIEGSYDFNSNIDYTLGFALRDLRAEVSDAFGEMEDDGLGNQFFLRMFGQVDAPEYKYDRNAAKNHRRAAIQAEKERLMEAIRSRKNSLDENAATPAKKDSEASKPPKTSVLPDAIGDGEPSVKPQKSLSDSTEVKNNPSVLNRRRKGKNKNQSDLLNPDDEDYL